MEWAWSGLTGQGSGLTGQAKALACQAGLTGRLAYGSPACKVVKLTPHYFNDVLSFDSSPSRPDPRAPRFSLPTGQFRYKCPSLPHL